MGLTQSYQSQQSFLVPRDVLRSASPIGRNRGVVPLIRRGSTPDFPRGRGNGMEMEMRQGAIRVF
jgi:hypothetical protein